MTTGLCLRVTSPILAIPLKRQGRNYIDIPAGSVIQAPGDLLDPGLRPVTFEGQQLLVFTRDIAERTEEI